jgi:uncharacterized protein (DUF1015 family)
MPRVKSFRAVRPPVAKAASVASVPYDVIDRDEAVVLAAGNSESFLHVVRPDIDLPPETDPYADAIYTQAADAFQKFLAAGTLAQDETDCIFLYRQIMNGRSQIGIVCCCHVDDYEHNRILKHEFTRPAKEDDRTRHVMTLGAHTGPVFLTYRDEPKVNQLVAAATAEAPLYDIADGHHRAASAWRAGKARREANPGHTGEEEYNWFLTVLFPANQLTILPYNRIIADLNGKTNEQILAELGQVGQLELTTDPVPPAAGSFCIFLGDRWYRLTIPADSIEHADPIASLDVALLEQRVIGPIFGIENVRTDPRIDFVGGIRGTDELERRVQSGKWAIAVSMHPTSIEQLMAVSDAGEVMPPKSTWFEPKLRSGLLVHLLE